MTRAHIKIVIPGIPPSVNMYVRHTKAGKHYKSNASRGFYDSAIQLSREALNKFGELLPAAGTVEAMQYEIMIVFYYAKGERGDLDNKAKIPIDALVAAGVINSDARVTQMMMARHRDSSDPRTEIYVREADPEGYPPWSEVKNITPLSSSKPQRRLKIESTNGLRTR